MNFVLTHSPLIFASFFIFLALILVMINFSLKKMRIITLILGLTISLISIFFLLVPPLIPNNWHILAALTTLFLMITLLVKMKNSDKTTLLLSSISFLMMEAIFLLKLHQEIVYTVLFITMIATSFFAIRSVFKKA